MRGRSGFTWFVLALAPFVACKGSPSAGSLGNTKAAGSASVAAPARSTVLNATPYPAASVSAMVNPYSLPPYSGPTGSIEGTITVVGDPAPDAARADYTKCPAAVDMYSKLFRDGPAGSNGARPLGDAIVGVIDIGDSKFFVPEKKEAAHVTIEGCMPTTRTVTMTYGQRLDVFNKGKDLFAPQFAQVTTPALMMATSGGDPVRLYPPKPGRYLLIDRIGHEYLTVDVFTFLFSLHDSTNLEGHYRIDGVPVGKRKVFTQHPSFDAKAETDVDVLEGVVHHVDLTLKYEAPKNVSGGVIDPNAKVKRPPTILR